MEEQKSTNNKTSEINFQPLTEGLGFHPFSDGLPYSPMTKKPYTSSQKFGVGIASGAGAVSAGPPRVAHAISKVVLSKSSVSKSKNTLLAPASHSIAHWVPGYGYLLKRVAAYLFDSILNSLLFGIIAVEFIWKQDSSLEILTNSSVIFAAAILMFFWNWVLITIQETIFGATLGKYMFGLSLRGSGVLLFLRSFFFLPSIGLFGVGLLFSLFDRRKRCWHDRLVGLQPIETYRTE